MTAETENQTTTNELLRSRDLPSTLQPLERLSWNYWWSWAPDGAEVFRDLEPSLWQQCEQNPRLMLARVSELRLTQMAADPVFADRVQRLAARFNDYVN